MDQQEFYLNQSLDHECFKLPEKDKKYLLKNNFLSEYFSEQDKAQVRSNLGITSLLDELKSFILAKLFDEEGNITFDLEPHEDAFDKVLSSAVIYNILLKYYTKEELDEWRESLIGDIYNKIQELKDSIHVDDQLDENSEYPVQNKVLYQIINQINNAYSRLSQFKADKEELLNYYTTDEIDQLIGNYYTKDQADESNQSLDQKIDGINQELSQAIGQTNTDLEQSVISGRNQLAQAVENLNQSINGVDNKIDQLDNQVEQLGQSINEVSQNIVVNGDNKTIKKENGILSTLLRLHQLTEQEIDDDSVESAYELQNSEGEKIGDRIVVNKQIDYSGVIEQLQRQIQQLQESQQKYIIIDESAYEQLTSYVQGAIYLVLEDGESVNHTGWKLGDGLPIILSGEWQFGDNLPIILS